MNKLEKQLLDRIQSLQDRLQTIEHIVQPVMLATLLNKVSQSDLKFPSPPSFEDPFGTPAPIEEELWRVLQQNGYDQEEDPILDQKAVPLLKACDYFDIEPGTGRNWCRRGKVISSKKGKMWHVCPKSFALATVNAIDPRLAHN